MGLCVQAGVRRVLTQSAYLQLKIFSMGLPGRLFQVKRVGITWTDAVKNGTAYSPKNNLRLNLAAWNKTWHFKERKKLLFYISCCYFQYLRKEKQCTTLIFLSLTRNINSFYRFRQHLYTAATSGLLFWTTLMWLISFFVVRNKLKKRKSQN